MGGAGLCGKLGWASSPLKVPGGGVEKDISHCVPLKSLIRLPLTDSVTLASDFSGPQFPRVENGGSVVGKVK